ncbi:MAG: hypothetical protein NT171_04070 [Planctomycetota bacterium]|nr:hypothetical protein [Planctomycetota bacterium]
MRPAAGDWLDRLRRFSAEHRLSRPQRSEPVPAETGARHRAGITSSAPAHAAQTEILAAHAKSWGLPTLTQIAATCPDGAIVVTTSPPGLAAWSDLIASLPTPLARRVATATEIEYRGWCMRSPDESHRLHAVVWSWIKAPLPPQRRPDFARFPIADSADYWVLRYGHSGGGEGEQSGDLFAWDGAVARLLATGITERFRSRG